MMRVFFWRSIPGRCTMQECGTVAVKMWKPQPHPVPAPSIKTFCPAGAKVHSFRHECLHVCATAHCPVSGNIIYPPRSQSRSPVKRVAARHDSRARPNEDCVRCVCWTKEYRFEMCQKGMPFDMGTLSLLHRRVMLYFVLCPWTELYEKSHYLLAFRWALWAIYQVNLHCIIHCREKLIHLAFPKTFNGQCFSIFFSNFFNFLIFFKLFLLNL